MELLMSVGIEGGDIVVEEPEAKTEAQETSTFDAEQQQAAYTATKENEGKILTLQNLIRKNYTPKASQELLEQLQDKSKWSEIQLQLQSQLGSYLPSDRTAFDRRRNFNLEKALNNVTEAFKHSLRNQSSYEDLSDETLLKSSADFAKKQYSGDSDVLDSEDLDENVDEIEALDTADENADDSDDVDFAEGIQQYSGDPGNVDYADQIQRFQDELARSFDAGFSPRSEMSSEIANEIVSEASKRSKAEQDMILEALYASDPEDPEDAKKDAKNERKSMFEKISEKIELEGDSYVVPEEVRAPLSRYCKPELRRWVEDAVGALVGKGFYNDKGDWIQISRIDREKDPESYEHATEDRTIPAYTFRVVGVPGNKSRETKRSYIPPPLRNRIPADLVGRYRFGITPELVENMQLSDKIKKVISYAYATETEIKRARLEDAITKFGKRPNDCGNTAVQLCMLNQRLRSLEEHVKVHKKDQNAKRQLRIVISKRRRLYKYLKRRDLTTYYSVLKDQVVEDKYYMYEKIHSFKDRLKEGDFEAFFK